MAPLGERSVNQQSPVQAECDRLLANTCTITSRLSHLNIENRSPASSKSKLLMSGVKVPSISAQAAPSPRTPLPVSRLPRRASSPSSDRMLKTDSDTQPSVKLSAMSTAFGSSVTPLKSAIVSPRTNPISIAARGQKTTPVTTSRVVPLDKPLPSRPIATLANSLSLTRDSRGLIDAAELPLRRSPGTPDEEEWPVLSPIKFKHTAADECSERTDASPGQTTAQNDNTFPDFQAFVPSSEACDVHPAVRHIEQYKSTLNNALQTPQRHPSLEYRSDTDTSYVYTSPSPKRSMRPTPINYSHPRARNTNGSQLSTPTTASASLQNSAKHATASRIPIFESKKTANIIDIKPRSVTSESANRSDIPTFGGRLLASPADLAALDNPRKRQPLSRKKSLDRNALAKKASLANMRTTFSKSSRPSAEVVSGNDRAPSSAGSNGSQDHSDTSSVRIKHISGKMLSSSFPGSTLTIADDAYDVLLGASPERVPRKSFRTVRPSHEGVKPVATPAAPVPAVSKPADMTVGLSSDNATIHPADASSSIQSPVNEPLAQDHARSARPNSDIISADDQEIEQHITATISRLEGTQPPAIYPGLVDADAACQNNHSDHTSDTGLDVSPSPDFHGSVEHLRDTNSIVTRSSTGQVDPEGETCTGGSQDVFERGPHDSPTIRQVHKVVPENTLPSYMRSTPASQARTVQARTQPADTSPNAQFSDCQPQVPRKASYVLGVGGYDTPRQPNSKRSPSTTEHLWRRDPTPTSQMLSKNDSSTSPTFLPVEDRAPISYGPYSTGTTGSMEEFANAKVVRTESRSRLVINNIRGLFTSKRDTTTTTKRRPVDTAKATKQTPNGHRSGNPFSTKSQKHGRPGSLKRQISKALLVPHSNSMAVEADDIIVSRPSTAPAKDTEIAKLTRTTRMFMEEAEGNSHQKEHKLSVAKILLDAVTNAREAERSMLCAQQAADSARAAHEMILHGVVELNRLMRTSNHF